MNNSSFIKILTILIIAHNAVHPAQAIKFANPIKIIKNASNKAATEIFSVFSTFMHYQKQNRSTENTQQFRTIQSHIDTILKEKVSLNSDLKLAKMSLENITKRTKCMEENLHSFQKQYQEKNSHSGNSSNMKNGNKNIATALFLAVLGNLYTLKNAVFPDTTGQKTASLESEIATLKDKAQNLSFYANGYLETVKVLNNSRVAGDIGAIETINAVQNGRLGNLVARIKALENNANYFEAASKQNQERLNSTIEEYNKKKDVLLLFLLEKNNLISLDCSQDFIDNLLKNINIRPESEAEFNKHIKFTTSTNYSESGVNSFSFRKKNIALSFTDSDNKINGIFEYSINMY